MYAISDFFLCNFGILSMLYRNKLTLNKIQSIDIQDF